MGMFCTLITFLQYFENNKPGGCFGPPLKSLGGKQLSCLRFLKYIVKTLLLHKICLSILGYIAYIFDRCVDACQANLFKMALIINVNVSVYIYIYICCFQE